MKKNFLILGVLMSSSLTIFAQSFLNEGKVWTMQNRSVTSIDENSFVFINEYMLKDDIQIDGILFKQLYRRTRRVEEESFGNWKPQRTYVGQNEGKVYWLYPLENVPTLVMDFSLQEGDSYKQFVGGVVENFMVLAVKDTVLENSFDKSTRKLIRLQSIDYPANIDVWIDGIGSVVGGLEGSAIFLHAGSTSCLLCCTTDGNIIYRTMEEYSCLWNKTLNLSPKSLDDSSKDLWGRRVTDEHGGILVQNGRKVMVK